MPFRPQLLLLPMLLLFAACANVENNTEHGDDEADAGPDIRTETISYDYNGSTYEGFIAWDANREGERPGVVIFHQWMGLTDYEKMRAKQLAKLGYVAFAADLYGKDIRPETTDEARNTAGPFYENRQQFRDRTRKAVDLLRNWDEVEVGPVGAMGYCFGGTAALELARSGADVAGIVTFHGGLSNPDTEAVGNISAPVLVLHGSADPTIDAETVTTFKQQMFDADVHLTWVEFDGALHSFTQKTADDDGMDATGYDQRADELSWGFMKTFWRDVFGLSQDGDEAGTSSSTMKDGEKSAADH